MKAKELQDGEGASSLILELLKLTRKTEGVLVRALRQKDEALALKAVQRLESQLLLKARLLGELEERRGSGGETHVIVTYVDAAPKLASAPPPKVIEASSHDETPSS